jgi:hypothetical protein
VADYLQDIGEQDREIGAALSRAERVLIENGDAVVATCITFDRPRDFTVLVRYPAFAQKQAQQLWSVCAELQRWDWLSRIRFVSDEGPHDREPPHSYDLAYHWVPYDSGDLFASLAERMKGISRILRGRQCIRHRSRTDRSVWCIPRTSRLLGRTGGTAYHASDASHYPAEGKAEGWSDIVPHEEGVGACPTLTFLLYCGERSATICVLLGPKQYSMYSSEYTSGFSGHTASHLAAQPPSPRHERRRTGSSRMLKKARQRPWTVTREARDMREGATWTD